MNTNGTIQTIKTYMFSRVFSAHHTVTSHSTFQVALNYIHKYIGIHNENSDSDR